MTTLWTETWTGTNGAAWPARWTTSGGTGSSSDIQSNAGRMRTGTTAFDTPREAIAAGESAVADMEVLVKCTFDNPEKTEYPLVAVRSNSFSGSYPHTGYFVELDITGDSYFLRKGVTEAYTLLSNPSKTFTAGTPIWIRLFAVGTAIKSKIWNDGSSEPGSWDVEVTDSSVAAAGYVGLSMQSGVSSTCTAIWDDMTVTDGVGVAAPYLPKFFIT